MLAGTMLDQSTLVLHRNTAKLPIAQRRALAEMYESNKLLAGKRVLIVDDDVRNIFALTWGAGTVQHECRVG